MATLAVSLAGVVVRAVPELVLLIVASSSVSEIADGVVGWVAVKVTDLLALWAWPEKRFSYKLMDSAGTSVPIQ